MTYSLRVPEDVLPKLEKEANSLKKEYGVTCDVSAGGITIQGDRAQEVYAILEDKRLTLMRTGTGTAKPRTEGQQRYYDMLRDHTINFGVGPAGTGKTRLAVDVLVEGFKAKRFDKLVLSRPAIEAGEKLGHLPGDLKEKVDPFMQPLYDSLNYHYKGKILSSLLEEKQIEIAPIAFLRGRTLSRAGIIIDEAQNLTEMQMKMVLTRLGEGSTMIITGDLTQTDLPSHVNSGLKDALNRLKGIKDIGICELTRADVVRHPLVGKIIDAYEG